MVRIDEITNVARIAEQNTDVADNISFPKIRKIRTDTDEQMCVLETRKSYWYHSESTAASSTPAVNSSTMGNG